MLPHLCDPLSRVELRNMRQLKVRYALKMDTSPQASWPSSQTSSNKPTATLSSPPLIKKLEGLLHAVCSALNFCYCRHVNKTHRSLNDGEGWKAIGPHVNPHQRGYSHVVREAEKSWQCASERFSRPVPLNGRPLLHERETDTKCPLQTLTSLPPFLYGLLHNN